MATTTTNYGLIKPAQEDFYDVGNFNDNADIIDAQIKAANEHADSAAAAAEAAAKAASRPANWMPSAADVGAPTDTAFASHTNNSNIHFLMSAVFSAVYPIGSYYETSDGTFDPNTTFGGTWVQDTKGRVLVGVDPDDTDFASAGLTGGEKTNTLTVDQLPKHKVTTRLPRHNMYYTSGTENMAPVKVGGLSGADNFESLEVGGDQPHNNMQPYTTVYRWHRTA